MKIKTFMIMVISIILVIGMSGCQLAREGASESMEDRLIGFMITTEYLDLFDMEGYIHDNRNLLSNGNDIKVNNNNSEYQERIYASLVNRTLTDEYGNTSNHREFAFENIDGISYFTATVLATDGEKSYTTSVSDEAITDGQINTLNTDNEEKQTFNGTIYVSSSSSSNLGFYFNPVYQSEDGNVYLTSGSGLSLGGEMSETTTLSHSMSSTTSINVNGTLKTITTDISVSITVMNAAYNIAVIYMDQDNKLITKEEYLPNEFPKSLEPNKDTAYIIVETYKKDYNNTQVVDRSIYSHTDDSMETFYTREDGICIKRQTALDWR